MEVAGSSGIVCPVCRKELPPKTNMSFHMMLHPSEKPFACDFCLVTFATKEDLKTHIKGDHVPERTHVCDDCGKVFCFPSNLKRHKMLTHSDAKRYTCIYCDCQFREYGQYRIHESAHDGVTSFRCETCCIYFASLRCLELHKNEFDCGSKVLTCCKETFTSRMDYVNHTLAKHKRYKKAAQKCRYCAKGFPYTYSRKAHELQCDYTPENRRVKKPEIDEEGNPLQHECPECKRFFNSRHGLLMHIRTHPRDEASKLEQFKCPICYKQLATRTSLVIHKARHSNAKSFYCQYCNKGFYTRTSMENHEVVHTKEKRFKCTFCSKAFLYRNSMTTHQRLHTGERPFPCRYCELKFVRFSGRQSHERLHTGERPFKCRVCLKSFVQHSTWKQHERTHDENIECECCGRTFATRKECKEHTRLHRQSMDSISETVEKVVQRNQAVNQSTEVTDADGNVFVYYQLQ